MRWQFVRRDLARNKVTSVALVVLLFVSTALLAAGAGTVTSVTGALDRLFERALVPHVLQMHAGDLEESEILAWASRQPTILDTQVLPTHPLPLAELELAGQSQGDSVLEPAATAQSPRFDFLLGPDDQPLQPAPGDVAVPLAYRDQVAPGDRITLRLGEETRSFTVSSYLRDAQMNPTLVTSKRLLFHPDDLEWVAGHVPAEYLIEFRLAEGAAPAEVLAAYTEAALPAQGPAIDAGSIRLLAGLSSMLIAAVIVLIAALVAAIGALTVRLAIRTAVAADLGQIGVLKAIGVPVRWIRAAYLTKYLVLAAVGAALGAAAAPLFHGPLTAIALVETGAPTSMTPTRLAWLIAAVVVAAGSTAYFWWLLRPIGRIPALEALRATTARRRPWLWRWRLSSSRLPTTTWLGLRGASIPGQFGLAVVFALLAVMCLLPAQFATTMTSPGFVNYLGVGDSDVLIETRDADTAATLESALATDPAVARQAAFTQVRGRVATPEGWEQLPTEVGDHKVFPLDYTDGGVPTTAGEIAVSHRVAGERGVGVGDLLTFSDGLGERSLRVSGVYQDITNGGRTAQGLWDVPAGQAVGWSYAVDLAPGTDPAATIAGWHEQFPGSTILSVDDYGHRVMGPIVGNLQSLGYAAIVLAGLVALGLTALFLRLVLASGAGEWAALRGIGLSDARLRQNFNARYLGLAVIGLVLGGVLATVIGQFAIAPLAGALLGAPGLQLLGVPWGSAVALPIVLGVAVLVGVRAGSTHLQRLSVRSVTEE